MLEMAYNNGYHRSIGVSPYQCMFSIQPNMIATSVKGGLCEDFEDDDVDDGGGGNGDGDIVCDNNDNDNDDWEVSSHTVLNGDDIDDAGNDDNDYFHNCSSNDMDSVTKRLRYIEAVRRKVDCQSVRSSKKMIKQQLRPNPPSLYAPGDRVIVRLCDDKKNRLSTKNGNCMLVS